MYMCVLPAGMFVVDIYTWLLKRSESVPDTPTRVIEFWEPPCECWEPDQGSPQEQ